MLRKTALIKNVKDMNEYLEVNFATPAATTFASTSKAVGLKRRVSFYVPTEGEEALVRCSVYILRFYY